MPWWCRGLPEVCLWSTGNSAWHIVSARWMVAYKMYLLTSRLDSLRPNCTRQASWLLICCLFCLLPGCRGPQTQVCFDSFFSNLYRVKGMWIPPGHWWHVTIWFLIFQNYYYGLKSLAFSDSFCLPNPPLGRFPLYSTPARTGLRSVLSAQLCPPSELWQVHFPLPGRLSQFLSCLPHTPASG